MQGEKRMGFARRGDVSFSDLVDTKLEEWEKPPINIEDKNRRPKILTSGGTEGKENDNRRRSASQLSQRRLNG